MGFTKLLSYGMTPFSFSKKWSVIFCLLAVSGQAMCGSLRIKPVDIRSVEVTVVDEVTKEPLPNIVLYNYIESVYRKSFLGIPQPVEIYYRGLAAERYKTDSQGRVCIPNQRVWTKLFHERVNSFDLYVNFDFEEQPKTVDPNLLNKVVGSVICDDRWWGLLSIRKYKTFFYFGYFVEEDEYDEGDPKEGELISRPFENPMWRHRQINFGSKFGGAKKITIELPRREGVSQ